MKWSEENWKSLSHVQLFATPWTVACQAPLSMGLAQQEYWSGLPFPSPGDLPNPWIKPWNPALQVDSLPSEPPGKPSHIINLPFFNNCLFKIYSRYPQILNPFKISTSSVYFIVAVVVAAVVFLCIHSSYIFTKIRRMWKKSHKFLLLFLSSFFLCHCWDCWDT